MGRNTKKRTQNRRNRSTRRRRGAGLGDFIGRAAGQVAATPTTAGRVVQWQQILKQLEPGQWRRLKHELILLAGADPEKEGQFEKSLNVKRSDLDAPSLQMTPPERDVVDADGK
jgi:hypothetical protein